MTARRLAGQFFKLFLLIYITADFLDPSIPAVFFFEGNIFIDGVVRAKTTAGSAGEDLAMEPMPSGAPADSDDGTAAIKVRTVTRSLRPQQVVWKDLNHDDSDSPSSLADSAPTPPQS